METSALPVHVLERVLLTGDLSPLSSTERLRYYHKVCESLGLNPLTRPFEYIVLGNRLTLYCRRDGTDQLRRLHDISIEITSREFVNNLYVVCARAKFPSGRQDESIGAVSIAKLTGNDLANAIMKCESKAKRRCTLSLCGLGMSDESEVESIPNAHPWQEPMVQASPTPSLPAPEPVHATRVSSTPAPAPAQVEPPSGISQEHAPLIVTEPMRKRLYALCRDCRLSYEAVKSYMVTVVGCPSSKSLTVRQYHQLVGALEDGQVAAWLERQAIQAEQEAAA
jgi:hypothetical protein